MTKAEIAARLIEVKEEICDDYCLWPHDYMMCFEDPEDAHEAMLRERCEVCPLNNFEI